MTNVAVVHDVYGGDESMRTMSLFVDLEKSDNTKGNTHTPHTHAQTHPLPCRRCHGASTLCRSRVEAVFEAQADSGAGSGSGKGESGGGAGLSKSAIATATVGDF